MQNEMVQVKKKPKSILRRTGFYAVLAFALCFALLAMVNHSIVFGNDNSVAGASAIGENIITGVPANAQDISFSHDDQYCLYLYNSKAYIKDIASDKIIKSISDSGITWAQLMNDRNNVLYFTQTDDTLVLKTYSMDNGTSTKQVSMDIASGSKLKDVDYSNATNLIYINLETTKGGKATDTVYSINIMKQLQKISSSTIVNNMVLLNNTGSLYFEDSKNNLYNQVKHVADLQTGHLIGCDAEDRVYVQSLDDKSAISVLSGNKVIKTLKLADTDYLEFYSDKSDVYAIYSDYIISISGDMSAKFTYNQNLTFLGLGGSHIYFRDSNNNIIALASGFDS